MVDFSVFDLLQQAERLTLYNRTGLQCVFCNQITIQAVSIRNPRPDDKAIWIRIRSSYLTRTLELQSFFIIPILIVGTCFGFDQHFYHVNLIKGELSRKQTSKKMPKRKADSFGQSQWP